MSESLYLWELGIHKGKYDERERIIAILESLSRCGDGHHDMESCECEAIALIKGEN